MTSRRLLVLAGLLSLALLAGCGSGVEGTGDAGYTRGDGAITVLPVADREEPGAVTGETLEGEKVSLASYDGQVVVLNVWGSWCPPCRKEAPFLAEAARELEDDGVVFLGINTRDNSRDNALAFQRAQDLPYTSIYDPDGRTLLAFRGTLPPNSIPSTVVIDREGRVAASVIGEVSSANTLLDIVEDVEKQ